ncbi:YciI family protein [Seohaeicola saemankumensis]|uniref:YciI family protein n=1 Tax=Seohaeicola saemankumensis TaxID=481181 RepID=UPI001E28C90C|nr:YciI family protein [Seohaeicola saemankumensis]MCD1625010.1 YciI family protein [Seohaeicola saemankumensis]
MFVALIARDKSGALETRMANRAAHLDYVKQTGVVRQAGPLLDKEEQMIGSLLILEVADMEQAMQWAAGDPYSKAGLFQGVELIPWKKVIG